MAVKEFNHFAAKIVNISFQLNFRLSKIPQKMCNIPYGKCTLNQIIQFVRCLFFIHNIIFQSFEAVKVAIPVLNE